MKLFKKRKTKYEVMWDQLKEVLEHSQTKTEFGSDEWLAHEKIKGFIGQIEQPQ